VRHGHDDVAEGAARNQLDLARDLDFLRTDAVVGDMLQAA
jgi:hypothetical protein